MKRNEILEEAAKCVCAGRNQIYDEPENNFGLIATYWEAYIKSRCVSDGYGCFVGRYLRGHSRIRSLRRGGRYGGRCGE